MNTGDHHGAEAGPGGEQPGSSASGGFLRSGPLSQAPGVSEAHLFPLSSHAPKPPALPAPPELPEGFPRLPTQPTSLEDVAERIEHTPESLAIRIEEATDNKYLNLIASQLLTGLQTHTASASVAGTPGLPAGLPSAIPAKPLTDPRIMPRRPKPPASVQEIAENIEHLPESLAIRLEEARHNLILQELLGGPQGLSTALPQGLNLGAPGLPATPPAAFTPPQHPSLPSGARTPPASSSPGIPGDHAAVKLATNPAIMPRLPTQPESPDDLADRIVHLPESTAIRLEEAREHILFKELLGGPRGLSTGLPTGVHAQSLPAAAASPPSAYAVPSYAASPSGHGIPLLTTALPGSGVGSAILPGATPLLPSTPAPAGAPPVVPPSVPTAPSRPPASPEVAAFTQPLTPVLSLPLSTEALQRPGGLDGLAARLLAPSPQGFTAPAQWPGAVPALPLAASPTAPVLPGGNHSAPPATMPGAPTSRAAATPALSAVGAEPEAPSAHSYYFLPQNPPTASAPAVPTPRAPSPTITDRGSNGFDVERVRRDFPILRQKVNGKPLVWLDNAATTQKPQAVIDRLSQFYSTENSNVHRAAHEMAARATNAYEAAREKVQRFLGAPQKENIIFTRGTTESINLLAQTLGNQIVGRDDEILVTNIEHHSNIVPWQHLVQRTGARLRVIPVTDRGEIDLEAYERLLSSRTRIVAMTHVSNALGTVVPVREMTASAHRRGAYVLVDAAQSVPHFPINVQDIDCDFLALSGHKLFGPTGVGVLFGRKELLDSMPPWQGGGNMIKDVTFEHTTYNPPPMKFEAGTAILAGAVGLGAAIDYLDSIGFEQAAAYEESLLHYGTEVLQQIPGLRLIGTAAHKAGVLSFVLAGVTPEALGEALNREGIAVRIGHHCAQPALRRFGLEKTVRPSLAFYNTRAEIDLLGATIRRAART